MQFACILVLFEFWPVTFDSFKPNHQDTAAFQQMLDEHIITVKKSRPNLVL